MTIFIEDKKTLYRCDICFKTRDYLSESWSTIEILQFPYWVLHHCLECRSDKKEYRP